MTQIGFTCGLAILLGVCSGRPTLAAEAGKSWPVGAVNAAIGQSNDPLSTCEIALGSSALTTGPNSFIALPQVDYFPPNYNPPTVPEFIFFGSAKLKFSNETSGTVTFDYYTATVGLGQKLPPPPPITFSNYNATPSGSATLNLALTLTIDVCNVGLQGTYHHM
jgi:hypothetical protein